MKILITGAAGYIGSILTPMLLAEGHTVTALDRFIYGNDTALANCCAHPNFEVHRVDCRDLSAVRQHVAGADVVIPLAGLVGVPLGNVNPVDAELLNLTAQLGLFTLLSHDQLVIMPTTESSYGSNTDVCTEETPLNPLSTYARHKVDVENALMARGNSISLRLATVFGMSPRLRTDLLVNDFTLRALRDRAFVVFEGKYRRTCVHVRDVARAFIHALRVNGPQGVPFRVITPTDPRAMIEVEPADKVALGIYNVGSCTMTKLSLCEAIAAQVPGFTYVEAPVGSDPDKRDYCVAMDKLLATGFRPEWTLDAGIAELLKGYRMLGVGPHRNA
ncbi:MAG: NAD(P)-dependent oxidoreductase [Chitinophagaceae bacterium]|nr:NAD(P)-dependent oxidoreductase [Rubrivivax sp.]